MIHSHNQLQQDNQIVWTSHEAHMTGITEYTENKTEDTNIQ